MNRKVGSDIICPHCKKLIENEGDDYPVSYWGSQDGYEDFDCSYCDKAFLVEENVERYYLVKKK